MAKPTPPPPPAPAPTPAPAGILSPDQFKWDKYPDGSLHAVAYFVAPAPGNYVIENSTDLVNWVDDGTTWNPSVAGAIYDLAFSDESLDLYNTAYRARPV